MSQALLLADKSNSFTVIKKNPTDETDLATLSWVAFGQAVVVASNRTNQEHPNGEAKRHSDPCEA